MTDSVEKIDKKIKRGGKRPGSGRKKGSPNRTTKAMKDEAAKHGEDAIEVMVALMKDKDGTPPAVRLAAAEKLLDRGFGKPAQAVDVTVENIYEDTPEDRAARDALYVKALENAAFDKARMLERVKSLNGAMPADNAI